jgi:hypothetical protein
LINAAVAKHGAAPAIAALLGILEAECGDLEIDRRLAHLLDADPRAIALLEAAR